VVSSALVYCLRFIAGEIHRLQSQYLTGSGTHLWWYRQLWHVIFDVLPLREPRLEVDLSLARTIRCGGVLNFGMSCLMSYY
jgi:hypothetical protein